MRRFLRILLAIPLGLAFFWLVLMKLISRVAGAFGVSGPCPYELSCLVDNPIRHNAVPRLLDRVGIRPRERVLELGPGPGAFTVEAARRAGPQGRVVAVDIQPSMIAQVEARVRRAGLANVETHVASAHSLPLPAASIDRAFLITVLGEIPDPDRALAELHRVLAPGGVLSIGEAFLDPDYHFPAETIRRVEAAGFQLIERHGNFWEYALNFRRVTNDAPTGMEVKLAPALHSGASVQPVTPR
jgi:SAM-dependent methyltransferase